MTDPFVGSLTFCRIYSGTLEAGSYALNSNKNKKVRGGAKLRGRALAGGWPAVQQGGHVVRVGVVPYAGPQCWGVGLLVADGACVCSRRVWLQERIGRLMMMHANNREDIKVRPRAGRRVRAL